MFDNNNDDIDEDKATTELERVELLIIHARILELLMNSMKSCKPPAGFLPIRKTPSMSIKRGVIN